jgi:sulfur-oxidizing protein SoxY
MPRRFSRRQALTIGAGALSAISAAAPSTPTMALTGDADDEVNRFTSGVAAVSKPDVVEIALPEQLESGNGVALTVRVNSPMTEASRVSELLVVARQNGSRAKIGKYAFFLPNGHSEVTTRVRLERPPAQTPSPSLTVTVTAVAKIRQGATDSFFFSEKQVKVMGGACEC